MTIIPVKSTDNGSEYRPLNTVSSRERHWNLANRDKYKPEVKLILSFSGQEHSVILNPTRAYQTSVAR